MNKIEGLELLSITTLFFESLVRISVGKAATLGVGRVTTNNKLKTSQVLDTNTGFRVIETFVYSRKISVKTGF